jgi:putative copper export protein/methionine-rich copper-binding protein CopC
MHSGPGSRIRTLAACCALLLLAAAPAASALHVRLEASTPAADETITEAPDRLRLRFSGRVELRYTELRLYAPDGSGVPLGSIAFTEGSDREFTAALPPINVGGVYTLHWRTAGADGHVLEGSYGFTLVGDAEAADPLLEPVAPPPLDAVHDHGHATEEVQPRGSVLPVFGRWLHFAALTLLLGAMAARLLLLPRLDVGAAARLEVQRGAWRGIAVAGLTLAGSAVLRLWLQSAALHGSDRAWSSSLLSIMLTDTTWGRAWLLQVVFIALLGAGLAAARPPRDRYALFLAVPAVLGLAAIPALQGHAAGAVRGAFIAVVNDAAHVLAVGTWIGMLAILLVTVLPALRRHEAEPDAARARAVERFSPVALGAAAVVVLSGVVNTLMHLDTPAQLWETRYGAALLAKLAVFSLVLLSGFYNWRIVRPRLAELAYAKRFRISGGFELAVAAFVLLATAILAGLPRP